MIKLGSQGRKAILQLADEKNILLEGNFIKLIDDEGDDEFRVYLDHALAIDKETRKKRLEVTRDVQEKNKELLAAQEVNESLMIEIREALEKAEHAKRAAESDLDLLQKRTQYELVGSIVRAALGVIIGVGIVTTGLYVLTMLIGRDTTLIENAWSNMFGILLTNSFSIIGTIMGVKYANSDEKRE